MVRLGKDSSSVARQQRPLNVRNEGGQTVQIQRKNAAEDSVRYKLLALWYRFFCFKVHNGLGCNICPGSSFAVGRRAKAGRVR